MKLTPSKLDLAIEYLEQSAAVSDYNQVAQALTLLRQYRQEKIMETKAQQSYRKDSLETNTYYVNGQPMTWPELIRTAESTGFDWFGEPTSKTIIEACNYLRKKDYNVSEIKCSSSRNGI